MSGSLGDRIAGLQVDPSAGLVLVTGMVAFALVANSGAWRQTRNVITIAHEAGHAVAALVTGRRLVGIRLHSDTSGLTLTVGRPDGPGMVTTLLAGYLSPSLLGLLGGLVLADGLVTIALWIAVALLLAMLALVRNVHGVGLVLGTGTAIGLVAWYAPAWAQAAFGLVGSWFLLIGAVRPVLELGQQHRAGRAWNSDADQLARLTPLPAQLWIGLLALVTVAALVLGSWLILR
jgi:Peptidase M50B-like